MDNFHLLLIAFPKLCDLVVNTCGTVTQTGFAHNGAVVQISETDTVK